MRDPPLIRNTYTSLNSGRRLISAETPPDTNSAQEQSSPPAVPRCADTTCKGRAHRGRPEPGSESP